MNTTIFKKSIIVQSGIRVCRVDFFQKINNRACTIIREARVDQPGGCGPKTPHFRERAKSTTLPIPRGISTT